MARSRRITIPRQRIRVRGLGTSDRAGLVTTIQGDSLGTSVPSPEHSTFEWDDYAITANGSAQAVPTIVIRDQYGAVMSGVTLTMTATNVVISAANTALVATPDAIEDDGVGASNVVLDVRDTDDEPVPDVLAADAPVVSNETATITPDFAQTDRDGHLTHTVTSTDPATHTLSATVDGVSITDTATLTVGEGEGEAPPAGEDPDYAMDSSASGTVRAAASGVTWNTSDADTSVVEVPAGRTGYGIQFLFPGTGAYYNAEQRFTLPVGVTRLIGEYYLHVPTGYVKSSSNDKFFRFWGDGYGDTNKVGASTWRNTGYANNASIRIDRTTTSGIGPSAPSGGGATSPSAAYGVVLNDWVRVRFDYRMESATNANDQRSRIWFDDVLAIDWDDQHQIYDTAVPYWANGYLFGAHNLGFPVETKLVIHEVKFWWTNVPAWAA
jgi:hypothetical protein